MAVVLILAATSMAVAEPSPPSQRAAIAQGAMPDVPSQAEFASAAVSSDTRRVADWVMGSRDNDGLPFVIIDKVDARVFAFSSRGILLGGTPALLGLAQGDVSPPGIGNRKLTKITPGERITPSGRFVAALGPDLGTKDVLWVDYDAAISLHRVFTGNASERRLARLATPSPLDNRISYGCINVPVLFYESVIHPLFATTHGIVYILPDTQLLAAVFPGLGAREGGVVGGR